MRGALLTAAVFMILAIVLAGVLPLWLDEILQLIETRHTSTAEMIRHLPHNTGAAPLGYLLQQATLRITGYSIRRARLPAAVLASAAVFAVALLGAELGLKHAWMAAAIFAAFPLSLRYATESRVYSQALFLSTVATLIYTRFAKRPTWTYAGAYSLVLTAAAYTQPYSACVGLAHFLWSIVCRERKTAVLGGGAFVLAIIAFLPWYLWSKAQWTGDIVEDALHFSASAKTPLMIFREMAGGSYWLSGLLVIVCAFAVIENRPSRRSLHLLVLLITVTIASVLAADAWFDYFIASRQFIWILPAVAILAAAAIEWHPRAGLVLAASLGVICIWQSVKYFTAPHEDWKEAARAIAEPVQQGACLVVAPSRADRLYEFFEPELRRAHCKAPRMVLAITPYTTSGQRQTAVNELLADGYTQESEAISGGSRIMFFRRP